MYQPNQLDPYDITAEQRAALIARYGEMPALIGQPNSRGVRGSLNDLIHAWSTRMQGGVMDMPLEQFIERELRMGTDNPMPADIGGLLNIQPSGQMSTPSQVTMTPPGTPTTKPLVGPASPTPATGPLTAPGFDPNAPGSGPVVGGSGPASPSPPTGPMTMPDGNPFGNPPPGSPPRIPLPGPSQPYQPPTISLPPTQNTPFPTGPAVGGEPAWPGGVNPNPQQPQQPQMPGNVLAAYGYMRGPNGMILPQMLNQGRSPFQQPMTPQGQPGYSTSMPGLTLPQMRFDPNRGGYQWFTPPPGQPPLGLLAPGAPTPGTTGTGAPPTHGRVPQGQMSTPSMVTMQPKAGLLGYSLPPALAGLLSG